MSPKLLTNNSISEIQRILGAKGVKRLAVAYWGAGAINELALSKLPDKKQVRILCDLFSGACNPVEMLKLYKSGFRFKAVDKLHSKVYCSEAAVIIGSSNASANGLAFGAKDLSDNIEANVFVDDRRFVATIAEWFDEFWESGTWVDPKLIDQSKPIWNANAGRGRLSTESLLAKLKKAPQLAAKISANVIFFLEVDYSTEAKKRFKQLGAGQYNEAQRRINAFEFPMYEDDSGWPTRPGQVYVELVSYKPGSRPAFSGVWKVRAKNHEIRSPTRLSPKNRIILLDRELSLGGQRISTEDAKHMGEAIVLYMNQNRLWKKTDDHGNFFEMPFAQFWTTVLKPYFASCRAPQAM